MALYEKPVRLLMRDMVTDFGLHVGEVFSKDRVVGWFAEKYPLVKEGTISAHLIRLSTNASSRMHYNAKPKDDDVFFQLDGARFRLYDPISDPPPIYEKPHGPGERVPPEVPTEPEPPTEFAYEADLRDFLAKNLTVLEPGLRLYQEEGIPGVEFPAGNRFIDILAEDSQKNLVIELKVSRGYDRVVGQLLRYIAWIAKHQAEPGQGVRGIIVAREISEDLLLATSVIPNVQLYEYQLSVTLKRIQS